MCDSTRSSEVRWRDWSETERQHEGKSVNTQVQTEKYSSLFLSFNRPLICEITVPMATQLIAQKLLWLWEPWQHIVLNDPASLCCSFTYACLRQPLVTTRQSRFVCSQKITLLSYWVLLTLIDRYTVLFIGYNLVVLVKKPKHKRRKYRTATTGNLAKFYLSLLYHKTFFCITCDAELMVKQHLHCCEGIGFLKICRECFVKLQILSCQIQILCNLCFVFFGK